MTQNTQSLSELTTMRVGGQPAEIIVAKTRDDLIEQTLGVWRSGEDWLILGGGSNLVVADEVDDLRVIKVETKGIQTFKTESENKTLLRIQAGENWDDFVDHAIELGLAGVEGMAGIPGTVGAGPVQNIGAYGQELSDTFVRLEFVDYETHEVVILEKADLEFGYRDSVIKRGRTGLITWVELELERFGGLSAPITSGQIAGAFGVNLGDQLPLREVAESVKKMRASKGMLLSDSDSDSVSCGSFFTNPVVSHTFARTLPEVSPRWETLEDDGLTVKLSAAWLIENSGINKGFALPGSKAAISSKHCLAITNRGGATAREIVELANYVQLQVSNRFGITLVPEPNLISF
jgi:UDP-N-acetylmuramate dehydrogenase